MVSTGTGLPHLDDVVAATRRYVQALTLLGDDGLFEPSLLPGWTRAHVVAHLARNADALATGLRAAAAGEQHPMYLSQQQRDADVETGARRSAPELRQDAEASARRWEEAARALPASRMDALVRRIPDGEQWPVRRLGMMRRREVEIHHADLGIGYRPADWPADLVDALLSERLADLAAAGRPLVLQLTDRGRAASAGGLGGTGPTVTGAAADAVWWLLGRGHGEGLACSEGVLPEIGKWR